ncbi:glycoside hydrolase family 92 protein [Flavobacterium sp. MAH-1]|uniref:Glycoside hydrolase family 92 protein n=1 Tax=Flavobacterium agri TaxID=2743471 RepID=A0A7Y8Y2W0_9FLAO|nr:GH92 family glycosyl hydrolase [Flavobacterium agri]NUY81341.1 glycoside hydrolase family 92 protein [Flavobacterium agri]NYA71365.1 glycoside hydrolase family 92 protein [Flavobacterium agri]
MRQYFLLLLLPVLGFSQLSKNVNPLIGTGGHGHTFPGATVPFGMVQLSPDTRIDGSWDGCGGYHYSDSVIYGFSHTHLSGTGVSDYGDIMLMPTMGEPSLDKDQYSSVFSHANEKVSAGYYAVKLDKFNIDVQLTASTRVGFHEYKFPKKGQANIVLDLNHRDQLLMGEVKVIDSKTIEVYRNSSAWATNQKIWARIEFDHAMNITKIDNNAFAPAKPTDKMIAGSLLRIAFSTDVKKGETIKVKVALSPTGFEGAKKNMSEITGWDFKKVKQSTEKLWDKQLSKITISETNKDKLAVFYTALYHTMIQPNIAQDIDGKYRGRDDEIHQAEGFDYYSVFSLWDTFRGAHPLYTLIEKKRTSDFINTFLKQYEQGGRLPVWEFASNETDCMIGYHSVSVMADAMAKGIKGFDYEKAFEAAKHSAMLDHLGLSAYKKNGFISMDDEHESVSKTVEYAYDDWCIAQMAKILDKKDDYVYFIKRSQSWKNVFDPETKHMRPKKNGGWDKPFDAREVNNNFTEGNSWHYSFFVPQDIPGMIEAYGGNDGFEQKLDEMFSAPSATTGREQADITGLIGQYAQGNEPSHHMVYLYNYIGKPEKAQEKIKFILDNFYKNTPDGLIGNEDCGQMSAWYVLSSLGLYSVTPGLPKWTVSKPYFEKITVDSGNGQHLIENGKAIEVFGFDVADFPKTHLLPENAPEIFFQNIVPVPAIKADGKSFQGKMDISFSPSNTAVEYFYKIDGKDAKFQMFSAPFEISETSTIEYYARDGYGKTSDTISSTFYKKPNDYAVAINSTYNKQYHAGGPDGLLDGILGSENWRKGDWQGYQGQDFEAVIDLKKKTEISKIDARFLQDSRAWILMPTKVEYYVSDDNSNFRLVKTVENTYDPKNAEVKVVDFTAEFPKTSAKYVKVKAYKFGKLPEWHQGFGGDAFIFTDEITIN